MFRLGLIPRGRVPDAFRRRPPLMNKGVGRGSLRTKPEGFGYGFVIFREVVARSD